MMRAKCNFTTREGAVLLVGPFLIFSFLVLVCTAGTAHAGTLMGRVEVEGNQPLTNLIIYLEPKTPSQVTVSPQIHQITQKGRKFKPELLVMVPGDTVQWLNDEDREIDHNVYSLNDVKPFDIGLHERGSIAETTFPQKGRLTYFCSVHKRMGGRLVILPSPYFLVMEKPGTFLLTNVPPGAWIMKAIVFHRRYKSESLTVAAGQNPVNDLILHIGKK